MSRKKEKVERLSSNGLIDVMPSLSVKYGVDYVKLGSTKISVADFTKFVARDGMYIPLICTSRRSSDIVIDFAPLLAVGISEFIMMSSLDHPGKWQEYIDWVHNLRFCKDWSELLRVSKSMLSGDMSDTGRLACSLRSGYIDGTFAGIRQVYASLMALRAADHVQFCRALIEAIDFAYSVILCFVIKDLGKSWLRSNKHSFRRWSKFSALQYGGWPFGKRKFITDARGVGICAFSIFVVSMQTKFATISKPKLQRYFEDTDLMRGLERKLFRCIGDDAIGWYLMSGVWPDNKVSDDMRVWLAQSDTPVLDTDVQPSIRDWKFGRGAFDSARLYGSAIGRVGMLLSGNYPVVDCFYGSRRDFACACMDFACSDRGIRLERKLNETAHKKLMNELYDKVDINGLKERVTKQAEAEARTEVVDLQHRLCELQTELDAVRKGKAEAETIISGKQTVIDGLLGEVRDLRAKVQSMYDVEEQIEVVDETVTAEEMLDFVNQFRLVIIGGRDTLAQRMTEAGFTNFSVISGSNYNSWTNMSADFFCIFTRFVSHAAIYTFESKHCDQLDQFFYFNGTNTDALLRVCYEFMKKWFAGSEAGCEAVEG